MLIASMAAGITGSIVGVSLVLMFAVAPAIILHKFGSRS